VKLYTSWDDGATAGNSLENRFPEYLAVTSRSIECQQNSVASGHFLILERAKKSQGAKSGE
jgi:hypothetical protein